MNNDFFEALSLLEKEKNIPKDYLLDKIINALTITVRRYYGAADNVIVDTDEKKGIFTVAIRKEIVEEVEDPETQTTLEEAQRVNKKAQIGETIDFPLETKDFGRIAAQTAKHVIRQGIREAERSQLLEEFQSKEHEIISAVVLRVDNKRGGVVIEVSKNEVLLAKSEQIPGEELLDGDRVKVYVVDVGSTEKGPRLMVSRTHPGLVKRLFELEVPEIFDGVVEIKSISREAGSRTKMAVYSKDENVDPVGACIGPKGARVSGIVDELCGEKIDVIKYSEDPAEYISAALAPASVISVEVLDDQAKACRVIVPDNQLSLAIGNKGQNARLAARLTGYKIDIKPQSNPSGETL